MDGAAAIALSDVSVSGNTGAGVQIKASAGVEVRDSTLAHNGSAGIFELAGSTGGRYVGNTIQDNGIGGPPTTATASSWTGPARTSPATRSPATATPAPTSTGSTPARARRAT
jgi:hypothetical protein